MNAMRTAKVVTGLFADQVVEVMNVFGNVALARKEDGRLTSFPVEMLEFTPALAVAA